MEIVTVRITTSFITSFIMGALAIGMAATAEAASRGGRCDPVVQEELDRLQVDPATVGAISYQIRTHENSRGHSRVNRVLAWVDLQSCTGKLVIELSARCRVKQAYTTDSCTVSGLAAY